MLLLASAAVLSLLPPRSAALAPAVGTTASHCRAASPRLLIAAEAPSRVVAFGDLHGDFEATLLVLRCAGLIDDEQRWSGGDTTLVQLGDILDRGDSERECWGLLQRLKAEAPASGGRVVCLVGNHEVLNVAGRAAAFLHPSGHTAFGPDRVAAWAQGGPLATALAECPVVAIVGDSAFVHAGLPAGARAFTRDDVERLNAQMRRWLLDPLEPTPEWIWGGEGSPVWDRSLSLPSGSDLDEDDCATLRDSLNRLGVSRVVVGHTPQASINAACGGAVWRCDTGMSRWVVGGVCEALEISAEGVVRVLGRGSEAAPSPTAAVVENVDCDDDGCETTYFDILYPRVGSPDRRLRQS